MLVSLSGIDGSGKTTLAKVLVDSLQRQGIDAVYSRPKYKICKQSEHFYHQIYGRPTAFNRSPDSTIYFHGLLMDWLTHYSDFISKHPNSVIVLDRYVYDVLAQGVHIGADVGFFDWFLQQMPQSQVDFYLDVDVKKCSQRVLARDNNNIRECESFDALIELHTIYREVMKQKCWSPLLINSDSLSQTLKKMTVQVARALDKWSFPNYYYQPSITAPICNGCQSYTYP